MILFSLHALLVIFAVQSGECSRFNETGDEVGLENSLYEYWRLGSDLRELETNSLIEKNAYLTEKFANIADGIFILNSTIQISRNDFKELSDRSRNAISGVNQSIEEIRNELRRLNNSNANEIFRLDQSLQTAIVNLNRTLKENEHGWKAFNESTGNNIFNLHLSLEEMRKELREFNNSKEIEIISLQKSLLKVNNEADKLKTDVKNLSQGLKEAQRKLDELKNSTDNNAPPGRLNIRNLVTPYTVNFGRNLSVGEEVWISGNIGLPGTVWEGFVINFRCFYPNESSNTTPLHFRYYHFNSKDLNTVINSHHPIIGWDSSPSYQLVYSDHFKPGSTFRLVFRLKLDVFAIEINGKLFANYKFPHGFPSINQLTIAGQVNVDVLSLPKNAITPTTTTN